MKFNKRDYKGAWAKVEAAGLTERQLDALKEDLLRRALQMAEYEACQTDGKTTHRIGGTGSLLELRGKDSTVQDALRVAVYWFHEHHNQRIQLHKGQM